MPISPTVWSFRGREREGTSRGLDGSSQQLEHKLLRIGAWLPQARSPWGSGSLSVYGFDWKWGSGKCGCGLRCFDHRTSPRLPSFLLAWRRPAGPPGASVSMFFSPSSHHPQLTPDIQGVVFEKGALFLLKISSFFIKEEWGGLWELCLG